MSAGTLQCVPLLPCLLPCGRALPPPAPAVAALRLGLPIQPCTESRSPAAPLPQLPAPLPPLCGVQARKGSARSLILGGHDGVSRNPPRVAAPLPSPVPANSPVAGRLASAGRRCGTGRDRGMHGGHARAEALPGAGCRDLGAPYRHRLRSFHHHPSSSVGALSGSGWDTWSPFALHVTGALRRDFLPVLRAQPTVTQSLWRSETPATNVACNGATCLHFARSPHPPIFSLLHSAMSAPTKLTPPHDRCPACSHMRTQTAPPHDQHGHSARN